METDRPVKIEYKRLFWVEETAPEPQTQTEAKTCFANQDADENPSECQADLLPEGN